jgi:hypothetical protein
MMSQQFNSLLTTPKTTGCQRSAAVQPRCVLALRGSFRVKRGIWRSLGGGRRGGAMMATPPRHPQRGTRRR